MERLISSMQDQISLLKKDLKDAHEQISTHQATATPTAALAATPASTVAATQPPPHAPAQPPPPAPLAISTRDTLRRTPIFNCHADSRTDDLLAASSVGKRDTSCPTVRPAPSSNACCANKRALMLAAHLEDRYWSFLLWKTTPKTP